MNKQLAKGSIYLALFCLLFIPLASASVIEVSGSSYGCGSGTHGSFIVLVDGVYTKSGTFILYCDENLQTKLTQFADLNPQNTVYINKVLIQVETPPIILPIKADMVKQINLVGASVQHGVINIPVLLTSNVSYPVPIDSNYNDGTYEKLYAGWFLLDADGNVLQSSDFIPISNQTIYNSRIQLVPYRPVYFFVTVIEKQNFQYNGTWKMTENIAVQNTKQLLVDSGVILTPTPTPPCVDCNPPTKSIYDIIVGLIQGFWRLLGFQI